MSVKFGPAGLGGISEAIGNLEEYSKFEIKACEIAFTYGVYIKKIEDALKIRDSAKKFGIELSIHAPYYINLNSLDKEKLEKSRQRILKCCEVGTWLGAHRVVFHAGFYGKMSHEKTYENIKKEILDLQKTAMEKGYTPKLAPEIMGKINVFGSVDEIFQLVRDTNCSLCIDFAHILSRYKDYRFSDVFQKLSKFKNIHIHFSGIEYGEKGERYHKKSSLDELKQLISNLPKDKNITVINESPDPVGDSITAIKIYKSMR